ncbi:MAG: hypothetical protein K2H92_09185 [Bacteroidaceae bacterium]|nr:hypothetical protein [Bacteroidaceae bacterium]MDE6721108.1 hypothetical protein [Bacteroidaceae bacterium]
MKIGVPDIDRSESGTPIDRCRGLRFEGGKRHDNPRLEGFSLHILLSGIKKLAEVVYNTDKFSNFALGLYVAVVACNV